MTTTLPWVLQVVRRATLLLGLAVLSRGDQGRAAELMEEALVLSRQLGDKSGSAQGLEGIAMVAATRGEAERTAVLWGTAKAIRETTGTPLPPDEHPVLRAIPGGRARVDEAAWEVAFEEGQAMSFEGSVEYALSEKEVASLPTVPQESPASESPQILTRREREIATLVARGLTNRQIASELMISKYTVATHVAKILKKLDLHSRSQLTAWVFLHLARLGI